MKCLAPRLLLLISDKFTIPFSTEFEFLSLNLPDLLYFFMMLKKECVRRPKGVKADTHTSTFFFFLVISIAVYGIKRHVYPNLL